MIHRRGFLAAVLGFLCAPLGFPRKLKPPTAPPFKLFAFQEEYLRRRRPWPVKRRVFVSTPMGPSPSWYYEMSRKAKP